MLALREGPLRFKELLAASGLSDVGLIKALKDLQRRGIIRKLPDGRYVLTDEGRRVVEELEVYELVREAIRRYDAETVRKHVEKLLKSRIAAAVAETEVAETLIRILRAWALITPLWVVYCENRRARASERERRAVAAVEGVLRKLGGDKWYEKFSTLLNSNEREGIEAERGSGIPVCGLAPSLLTWEKIRGIPGRVDEELAAIKQERLNLLDTELRQHLLFLLRAIEERKRGLEQVLRKLEKRKRRGLESYPVLRKVLEEFLTGEPQADFM